jgi:hypothetical protein
MYPIISNSLIYANMCRYAMHCRNSLVSDAKETMRKMLNRAAEERRMAVDKSEQKAVLVDIAA